MRCTGVIMKSGMRPPSTFSLHNDHDQPHDVSTSTSSRDQREPARPDGAEGVKVDVLLALDVEQRVALVELVHEVRVCTHRPAKRKVSRGESPETCSKDEHKNNGWNHCTQNSQAHAISEQRSSSGPKATMSWSNVGGRTHFEVRGVGEQHFAQRRREQLPALLELDQVRVQLAAQIVQICNAREQPQKHYQPQRGAEAGSEQGRQRRACVPPMLEKQSRISSTESSGRPTSTY